jgi:SpoVK/Ycf46/Vps4 family AAA+-type ATPase
VRLDDVILPAGASDHLDGFLARIHNRDRLQGLGVRSRGAKGRGITALFSGPSGTGKTLSAEAICGELGVDLYVVNLPSVLSKYIGETEQNLERVFTAAEDIPGILFFDEADAMFGKRSDVSDARDRYANLEVSYLLQRLERFDGIVVLATNLRANLDDAFNRRLDAVIAFPAPGEAQRILLWQAHLPSELPLAKDLDLAFAASRFELSGGAISSAAQSAAHEMLRREVPLDNGMLARAIAAELDKSGRLVQPSDFGPWMEHLDPA